MVKFYEVHGPRKGPKVKMGIYTPEEVKEDLKKYMGTFIGNEEYLSVKELLGLAPWSAGTIRKYIRAGKIPGRKFMKKWYVARVDFWKFLGGS